MWDWGLLLWGLIFFGVVTRAGLDDGRQQARSWKSGGGEELKEGSVGGIGRLLNLLASAECRLGVSQVRSESEGKSRPGFLAGGPEDSSPAPLAD
jgi:hypothetical protein